MPLFCLLYALKQVKNEHVTESQRLRVMRLVSVPQRLPFDHNTLHLKYCTWQLSANRAKSIGG